MSNTEPRILVAVPAGGDIKTLTARSLLEYQMYRKYPAQIHFKLDTSIEKARNELVRDAVASKATHLMFVDSDMVFPTHAIDQMVDRQKDIIGGVYYGRMHPKAMAYTLDENRKNIEIDLKNVDKKGLLEADFIGTGFMLINMKVFEKLEPPFFHFSYDYERFGFTGNDLAPIGEDTYFCYTAKQAGFKIWVDTTFELGHVGMHTYRKLDNEIWKENKEVYERV